MEVLIVFLILYLLSPIPLLIIMLTFLSRNKKLQKENEDLREQLKKEGAEFPVRTPVLPMSEQQEGPSESAVSSNPPLPAENTAPVIQARQTSQTNAEPAGRKTDSPLNSTAILFFIGVFLVSVGITVFAASTWKYQGLAVKSFFLAALSGISFLSAWISEKKLKLRQTSITAFSLGFVFIEGILFLAANANAFGGLLALKGRGFMLLLCLVFLLIIIYGIAVRRLYKYAWSKWVALGAYQFFLVFFVRFLDCGQTLFPFLFLTGISSILLFIREEQYRPFAVIAEVAAFGTSVIGFIASFVSICIVSLGGSEFLHISLLTPSVILSVSSAGIFLSWLFMVKKLPVVAAALPFSFLAFAYSFQNIYIAVIGTGIMTAAGCKLVFDNKELFSIFRRTFLFTGPALSALFILLIPGKIWMLAFAVFCIFLILSFYGCTDRNPVVISAAFVALAGFVFFLLWTLFGSREPWMYWAVVLFCGISAILLQLKERKGFGEFRRPAEAAMILGMAVAAVYPDPEFTPLSMIAMAVLVCSAYPTRLQMFLALPVAKVLIHLFHQAAVLPDSVFTDSYMVLGILFAAAAALSLIPDKQNGFLGMNCFVPVALALTVYGAAELPWQTWKAFAVILMLAVISASQIRRDRKTKYVTVPLTIALALLAVCLQPFIGVPDYLICKLPAAIPFITIFACGRIFGKFRLYDTGLCIGLMIFMAVIVMEIIIKQSRLYDDSVREELIRIIIDKVLLLGLSVMTLIRSEKHGRLWYYTGYAFFLLLGITHLFGEQSFVCLMIQYAAAVALSCVPDKAGSNNVPMFSAAAFFFALMMLAERDKTKLFVGLLLMSAAVLSLLRNGNQRYKNAVLAVGSALAMLAVYAQPFFQWPDFLSRKLIFMIPSCVCVIVKKAGMGTAETSGKSTVSRLLHASLLFLMAALCLEALIKQSLLDMIIAVAFCVLLTMFGAQQKNRLLLYGGAAGVVINVLYATRKFWTSLPWWVYLIAVGAAAILFAVRSELKRRNQKGGS